MIIGITGYKFSGKDTVADFICHLFPHYKKVAFASPIKEALNIIFNWDDSHWSEENKETIDPVWGISPRQAAQHLGTDWGRQMLPYTYEGFMAKTGSKIWINSALNKGENIVVSDVRFVNEADAIHARGGIIVRLNRFDTTTDPHPSEREIVKIKPDYEVDNKGEVEYTLRTVRKIVERHTG